MVTLDVPTGVNLNTRGGMEPDTSSAPGCGFPVCAQNGQAIWLLGQLQPGENRTIDASGNIDNGVTVGQTITTMITVSANEFGADVGKQKTALVVADDDVDLRLSSSADPAAQDQIVILTVDAANASDSALNNGALTLQIPAQMSVVSADHNGVLAGSTISWPSIGLAPGAAIRRSANVQIKSDASHGLTLAPVARLRHDGGLDIDEEVTAVVSVSPRPQLDVDFSLLNTEATEASRLRYQLTLGNTSSTDILTDLSAYFRVPPELSIDTQAQAFPNANDGDNCGFPTCDGKGEASWSFAQLGPNESVSIDFEASVKTPVAIGSLAEAQLLVRANELSDDIMLQRTARVVADESRRMSLTTSADPVARGQSLRYTLDFGNANDGAISNAELSLVIPDQLQINSASDGGVISGQSVSWTNVQLPAGQSLRRFVDTTVSGSAPLISTLTAVARAQYPGGNQLDNEVRAPISIAAPQNLEVDVSMLRTEALVDGALTYVLSIGNRSQVSSLSNVYVQMRLPEQISLNTTANVSPDANDGSGCGFPTCAGKGEATWQFASLDIGESVTIIAKATVNSAVPPGSLVEIPVVVVADEAEDTVVLRRTGRLVLDEPVELVLQTATDPQIASDTNQYTMRLGNRSLAQAQNLDLELELPDGLTVNTISNGGSQNGNTISWPSFDLSSGSSTTRTVSTQSENSLVAGDLLAPVARLRHSGGLGLDQQAQTVSSVADSRLLQFDYQLVNSTVQSGGTIGYRLSVTNTSVVTSLSNIYLVLRVPPQVELNTQAHAVPDANDGDGCGFPTCDGKGEASWTITNLAPGATADFIVDAVVKSSFPAGTLIDTPAMIISESIDDVILKHTSAVIVDPAP